MNILVVPDKFKGTLSAAEAAEAMIRGWRAARPADSLRPLPMSDGGDGFGEVLSLQLGAEVRHIKTLDAAHRPVESPWWWHAATQTAVIESARVIGLAMLPPRKYHPYELDTFGLGAVLQAAASAGARRCLVGIGGSATNDGGFGLGRALGWQFCNAHEEDIHRWTDLHRLSVVRPPAIPLPFAELIVAVDVQNPLLGPEGCSRIYGPQKGLTEFELAERCLGQLAAVLQRHPLTRRAVPLADVPGAGAAGGLGYGLMAFAGARSESGFDLFARQARLEEQIRGVDLVITGEGALDAQSLMGKGVGGIAALCQQTGIPCVALAGVVTDPENARSRFQVARGLTPGLTDKESALREPARWLEQRARDVAAGYQR